MKPMEKRLADKIERTIHDVLEVKKGKTRATEGSMRVTRLVVVLLVTGIVLLLCSLVLAQNKSQYRTGRLSKVEDATDLLDTTTKLAFSCLSRPAPMSTLLITR